MRHQEPELVQAETAPHHHRDNMRHSVRVPARLEGQAGLVIPCTITDVSRTGMALAIDGPVALEPHQRPLAPGARARVRFRRRSIGSRALVAALVTVIWATHRSFGVRFIEPDEELVTALREIVANAVNARRASHAVQRHELTPRARKALRACRKVVQQSVSNLAWVVRNGVVRQLLLETGGNQRTERPTSLQPAAAEAARLEERALSIGLSIEQSFLRGFSEAFDLDQTQELTFADVHAAGARQAADDVTLGDPRLLARVVLEVEQRHGERYRLLARRLARVHGAQADGDDSPLAPPAACRVVWNTFIAQADSPRIERILEQVMQREAVPLLGDLYDALAHVLDTHRAG
ncbi:MAG: PilZ domain-containing protein [Gammaproteobacteria bacterium]